MVLDLCAESLVLFCSPSWDNDTLRNLNNSNRADFSIVPTSSTKYFAFLADSSANGA
ncbi:hypothetical protein BOTU111922_04665 [Bordetella tumulicola]